MNQSKNNNKGFTIIELMAVVSILSILAVLALAVYGDYVVRGKVAEGMGFVAEARTSVSEYYYDQKEMPENNSQAGLIEPEKYDKFDYISRLEISSSPEAGKITVTFKIEGQEANGKKLELVPSTMNGLVFWECRPTATDGMDVNQVPPNCRG